MPEFYPRGFLPGILPTINDQAITIGIRRKGTWNVDASLTHGENSFQFNIENSVNASLGTSSPTTFDAGTLTSSESVADLDLVRTRSTRRASSRSSLVLGSELRVERYRIEAGDRGVVQPRQRDVRHAAAAEATWRAGVPGVSAEQRGRSHARQHRPLRRLRERGDQGVALDVGGRFESYSDFGRSLIGRIAGRAKLVGPLALRAAAGTGFRAPSLQQLWFSNVSTLFLPDSTGTLQPAQVLTSNNQSPVTKAFGIPKLNEERSINLSGGLTVRPNDSFSLTARRLLHSPRSIASSSRVSSRTQSRGRGNPRAVPRRQSGAVLRERGRHRHQGRRHRRSTTASMRATAR